MKRSILLALPLALILMVSIPCFADTDSDKAIIEDYTAEWLGKDISESEQIYSNDNHWLGDIKKQQLFGIDGGIYVFGDLNNTLGYGVVWYSLSEISATQWLDITTELQDLYSAESDKKLYKQAERIFSNVQQYRIIDATKDDENKVAVRWLIDGGEITEEKISMLEDNSDTVSSTTEEDGVTAVRVTPENDPLGIGGTAYLQLNYEPKTIKRSDVEVTFESSNPEVCSVNGRYAVGVSEGTAIITATASNGVSGQYEITVSKDAPISIEINPCYYIPKVGISETLTYTIQPEEATNDPVKWSTFDTDICTVDEDGTIHELAPGEATIYAETSNNVLDSITITIREDTTAQTQPQSSPTDVDTPPSYFKTSMLSQSQEEIRSIVGEPDGISMDLQQYTETFTTDEANAASAFIYDSQNFFGLNSKLYVLFDGGKTYSATFTFNYLFGNPRSYYADTIQEIEDYYNEKLGTGEVGYDRNSYGDTYWFTSNGTFVLEATDERIVMMLMS